MYTQLPGRVRVCIIILIKFYWQQADQSSLSCWALDGQATQTKYFRLFLVLYMFCEVQLISLTIFEEFVFKTR